VILWAMIGAQILAWGYFSWKGGRLSDKHFLIFTAGMLLGQLASVIETYFSGATRTFVVQIYFFLFTVFGGIQRFREMRKSDQTPTS
jgi:hypothetical protein